MTGKIILGIIGSALLSAVPATSADYYSVARDARSGIVIESAWQETPAQTAWAPQPLKTVVARGISLKLPKEDLAPHLDWEMDLGILQPDGNIMHLLGTVRVSEIVSGVKTRLAAIAADLSGVQDSDCRAHLSAIVDANTRALIVEKFVFNCLGHEATVATALYPRE